RAPVRRSQGRPDPRRPQDHGGARRHVRIRARRRAHPQGLLPSRTRIRAQRSGTEPELNRMSAPARKTQHSKGTARAGLRPARANPRAGKVSASDAAYKEAIEQQAATAEILRAMSRSPADVQPIFQAIVDKAHALCGAVYSVLYRYDGATLTIVADKHVTARASRVLRARYPQQ